MILYLRVAGVYSLYAFTLGVCASFYSLAGVLYAAALVLGLSLLIAIIRYPRLRYDLQTVQRKGRAGYLYGFSDIGQLLPVVKIGRETYYRERLRGHNTGAPFGMHIWFSYPVPDAVYAEKYLHRRYGGQRYNRHAEWFYLTPVMWFELRLLGLFGA